MIQQEIYRLMNLNLHLIITDNWWYVLLVLAVMMTITSVIHISDPPYLRVSNSWFYFFVKTILANSSQIQCCLRPAGVGFSVELDWRWGGITLGAVLKCYRLQILYSCGSLDVMWGRAPKSIFFLATFGVVGGEPLNQLIFGYWLCGGQWGLR